MNKLLELLVQRRVWSGIVGAGGFVLALFSVDLPNAEGLTEVLANFGAALAPLIAAALALHSFLFPKK